jgi:hypothetical protein
MMMAPVQLWNPTELVSAAAPAAAAAAARTCTQTLLCLGSKFRDADDERESVCGVLSFTNSMEKTFSNAKENQEFSRMLLLLPPLLLQRQTLQTQKPIQFQKLSSSIFRAKDVVAVEHHHYVSVSLSPSLYLSLSCISVSVCLSVLHLIVVFVQQHQVSTFCHMPAILMQQQMRRKIIHEQDCLHEQAIVNIVVVVQQQTSDLHFSHMPAILLQQENNRKKRKRKKEKKR